MAILREPLDVDFLIQSEDWTENELALFRKHLAEQKINNHASEIVKDSIVKNEKSNLKFKK